jgi:hypothetical protein
MNDLSVDRDYPTKIEDNSTEYGHIICNGCSDIIKSMGKIFKFSICRRFKGHTIKQSLLFIFFKTNYGNRD